MKGIVRVSVEHVQLALIPSMMILALLMEIATVSNKLFKAIILIVGALSIYTALSSGIGKINKNKRPNLVVFDITGFYKLLSSSNIPSINVVPVDSTNLQMTSAFIVENDRNAAIHFIIQNTIPDERIFIGLTRHDKVFVNDVSSYFNTNRLPATKWHHFDPGLQSSREIQSEITVDLERYKPRYIWLESSWDKANEPNESANSSGVIILDEYIRNKYVLAQNFGQRSVWQRQKE